MKVLMQGQWASALKLEMDEEEFQLWKATGDMFRLATENGTQSAYCFFLVKNVPVLVIVRKKYPDTGESGQTYDKEMETTA